MAWQNNISCLKTSICLRFTFPWKAWSFDTLNIGYLFMFHSILLFNMYNILDYDFIELKFDHFDTGKIDIFMFLGDSSSLCGIKNEATVEKSYFNVYFYWQNINIWETFGISFPSRIVIVSSNPKFHESRQNFSISKLFLTIFSSSTKLSVFSFVTFSKRKFPHFSLENYSHFQFYVQIQSTQFTAAMRNKCWMPRNFLTFISHLSSGSASFKNSFCIIQMRKISSTIKIHVIFCVYDVMLLMLFVYKE